MLIFVLFKDTKVLSHINEAGLAQIYPMGRSRYPGHQGPDFCFDFMSFPLSSGCGSLRHLTSLPYTLCFMFFFSRSYFFLNKFIYLLFFGCVGSLFLCEGFLQLRQAGATLHRGAWASHYRGLSCCGAQAPDAQAQ